MTESESSEEPTEERIPLEDSTPDDRDALLDHLGEVRHDATMRALDEENEESEEK